MIEDPGRLSCSRPLVGVGLPVRNGARTLERAVRSITEQSYENLEIVVSDNASTDETPKILRRLAGEDRRIHVVRHKAPVTALENFRAAFEATTANFFLWAAHDDLRSKNYVEVLLNGLLDSPNAAIAFSDVILFDQVEHDPRLACGQCVLAHDFEARGVRLADRLKKQARCAPFHIYGLIRARYLRQYRWYDCDHAFDWALIAYLACRGDFIFVPGATFYYYYSGPKTLRAMALANALRKERRFPRERIAWICASAVCDAERMSGRAINRLLMFVRMYVWQHHGWKNLLYTRAPSLLRRAWSHWKTIRSNLSASDDELQAN